MSLRDVRRSVGQLAIVGFTGHTVPDDVRMLAREFDLGGVIFFARNVADPEQVADLSRESQELATEVPLWISVDQEGGRVARLKRPFTEWPPMATLGRAGAPGDEKLAERFARALAAELHAVGISLDYTPVLDVLTNPKNPVIGDRSLAERADDVARLGSRDHPRPCRERASPPAASTFRGTAIPASTRTSRCRCSITHPIGSRRWSWCRSRRRSPPAWRRS